MLEASQVSARAARWGWLRDEEDDEDGGWYCEERDCDWGAVAAGSAAAEEEVEDSLRERVRAAVELDGLAGAPATESGSIFRQAPTPSPGATEGHRFGLIQLRPGRVDGRAERQRIDILLLHIGFPLRPIPDLALHRPIELRHHHRSGAAFSYVLGGCPAAARAPT
ncbi:hypothetical protein FRC04_009669 [Tulasnella sp. 424]|nr:hypothetical protein FRC04_009669 [Tulasnella sp. 424]KAG8975967.1 hypothetical protein FRC05_004898 [Tulasnella sp. 425]